MRLQVLDLAGDDLLDGFKFYEQQAEGVGTYFFETLVADIESLRLFGGIHRKTFSFQRLLSNRFPFAIYYKIEGELVSVWRVLDCRSDPVLIRKTTQAGPKQALGPTTLRHVAHVNR